MRTSRVSWPGPPASKNRPVGESTTVLAGAMVLLLLVVFIAVNAAVLVLRRDPVGHHHYRVPVVLPIAGLVSCLLLMTQVEGQVWRLGLPFLLVASAIAGLAAWGRGRSGHRSHGGAAPAPGPGAED